MNMNTVIFFALLTFELSPLFIMWLIDRAPLGYEDERGFHLGCPSCEAGDDLDHSHVAVRQKIESPFGSSLPSTTRFP